MARKERVDEVRLELIGVCDPEDRPRVILVVLQRHTAVSGAVGVNIGLHPVVGKGVLASQRRRTRQLLTPGEDTPVGALAVTVGHVLARDGAH